MNVVASSASGSAGSSPNNGDELLLSDHFSSSGGSTWSVNFSGLVDGASFVFLYAPSKNGVSTGPMTVGGIPVGNIPGVSSSTLIEGMSWVKVQVTVSGGALVVSGGGFTSGLAGIQVVPLPGAETYCTPGVSASGCQALISSTGTASATAVSGFALHTSTVEGNKDGLYFFGANGRQSNPWGNGTSLQCVATPVKRGGLLTGVGTAGLCDGSLSQDLNALWCSTCPRPLHNPGAGAVVQAQLWYRDPMNTSNQTTSLSDAIEFQVGP